MKWRAQLTYLAVVLLLGLNGPPVFIFSQWAWQVAACRHLDRPGAYLAYCTDPQFGSYEHEAYLFGLEPEAIQGLRQAQVLFLGNSRLQFAFSTPAVTAFFAAHGITYHLLGFGYGESSRFPRELLLRYRPAPKVVIINADPFFQSVLSPAAEDIRKAPSWAVVDGLAKWLFVRIQPLACRFPMLCSDIEPTTYRDRQSGQWIWQGALMPRGMVAAAITGAKSAAWSEAELPAWQQDAGSFLSLLETAPSCIILTGVPTPAADAEGMATTLGDRLGLTVVMPRLHGLTSSDGSHLSAESAERWSAAFLSQAEARIAKCLTPKVQQVEGQPP